MQLRINFDRKIIISMMTLSFAFIFIVAMAYAQQAATLNVKPPLQGKLSDSTGKPLTGQYDLKFEIYSAETGGSALWSEEQKGLIIVKGKFQINLGNSNPLTENLAVDNLLYVQIYVKGPSDSSYKALNPRLILNPTFAKAPRAKTADTANSVPVAGIIGQIKDAMIEAVSGSKIIGLLNINNIPGLDAGKIISGVFDAARIPNLDVSKIITGVFDAARIPSLDAGKIASGVFDLARIPNLDVGKITTGVFDVNRLPVVDSKLSYKVSGGVSSVADGAPINFNSNDRKFGVTGFSTGITPVVVCSSEDHYICSAGSADKDKFFVKLIRWDNVRPTSPTTVSVNWIAIGS